MFLATTSARTLKQKKKDVALNAKFLKSKGEFIIICSNCCAIVTKVFNKKYCDYFTSTKNMFQKGFI